MGGALMTVWPWTRKRVLACGVVLAVGLGLAAGTYWRSSSRRSEAIDSFDRTVLEVSGAVRAAALVPMADASAFSGLMSCEIAGASTASPAQRDALRSAVRTFLERRFLGAHEDYVAWRASEGYVPRSIADLRATWFLDEATDAYLGRRSREDDSTEALFVECARIADTRGGAAQVIRSVAASPDGWSIELKRLTPADPALPDVNTAPIPAKALSYCRVVSSSNSWWRYSESRSDMISGGGGLFARVSFFAGFGDGDRRAVGLSYYWHPPTRRWVLDGLVAASGNAPGSEDHVRVEY